MKKDMLDVFHDFNNLLTTVIGSIKMAKKYVGAQANLDEALKMLCQAEEASNQLKDSLHYILHYIKGKCNENNP